MFGWDTHMTQTMYLQTVGNKPCMWPCGGRVVASVRASYNNIVFSRVKCMHGLVSGCMDKLLAGRDSRVVTWACGTWS